MDKYKKMLKKDMPSKDDLKLFNKAVDSYKKHILIGETSKKI